MMHAGRHTTVFEMQGFGGGISSTIQTHQQAILDLISSFVYKFLQFYVQYPWYQVSLQSSGFMNTMLLFEYG